jgi:Uma2 family endonuclease
MEIEGGRIMSTAVLDVPAMKTPLPRKSTDWIWLYDAVDRLVPGQTLTATGANWQVYQRVMERRDGHRPGMRVQYDRGVIHLMPTYLWHELCKKILSSLFECYCEERQLSVTGAGMMTVSREDRDRGFEPDECYYVANVQSILGKKVLDFRSDPPPDLTMEIEHTVSVSKRLGLFAEFKIAEVWKYDGQTLSVLRLNANGHYESIDHSHVVPGFPFAEVSRHLAKVGTIDQISVVREFRNWIRQNQTTQSQSE